MTIFAELLTTFSNKFPEHGTTVESRQVSYCCNGPYGRQLKEVGRVVQVSVECAGVNYALLFHDEILEIRARPLTRRTLTVAVNKIKSIELMRQSIMPPAMIGAASLILGSVLRIAEEALVGIVPLGFQIPLQLLAFGVAIICLAIMVLRYFFGNLILKPVDGSPIVVRMVPTSSGQRFIARLQQTSRSEKPQRGDQS